MTKLLLILSSIVSLTGSAISTIALTNNQEIKSIFLQVERLEYSFEEVKGQIELRHGQWKVFEIDNINLTKLGITSVKELHQYNTISVPGFSVFANRRAIREDQWKAKINIGQEGWSYIRMIREAGSRTELYRAAKMWYETDSNDLMLRLSYKVQGFYFGGKKTIYYNSGTKLIFT